MGASFDYAVEESQKRAVTQARESVARAVSRVEERIREQRVSRALTRFHTADRHALVNDKGDEHVTGIYRWVDKIKTVQVFRYPHRLLFEFEVPEPGAFIRWLHGRPRQGARPVPFLTLDGTKVGTPLVAENVTAGATDLGAGRINYQELAGRYAVQGLEPPPGERMVFASVPFPRPPAEGTRARTRRRSTRPPTSRFRTAGRGTASRSTRWPVTRCRRGRASRPAGWSW